jgi:hypothetical protein
MSRQSSALANLETQKEEAVKALDAQITSLSEEIVKKVLPSACKNRDADVRSYSFRSFSDLCVYAAACHPFATPTLSS